MAEKNKGEEKSYFSHLGLFLSEDDKLGKKEFGADSIQLYWILTHKPKHLSCIHQSNEFFKFKCMWLNMYKTLIV
jgi:hypothetical protein